MMSLFTFLIKVISLVLFPITCFAIIKPPLWILIAFAILGGNLVFVILGALKEDSHTGYVDDLLRLCGKVSSQNLL